MTFVNQYTQPDLTLVNAATYREGNATYVYGVGYVDGRGVVLKAKTNGETVWSQQLTTRPLRFTHIQQLVFGGAERYVISGRDEKTFFLLCINTKGKELWHLEVATQQTEPRCFMVADGNRNGFYFAYTERDPSDNLFRPKLLLLNGEGKLLTQRWLVVSKPENKGFVLSAIRAHAKGLVVAGNLLKGSGAGIVVALKQDLTLQTAMAFPGMDLQDLLVYDAKRYYVSAYSHQEKAVVLIPQGFTAFNSYAVVPKSAEMNSLLCLREKGFVLAISDASRGRVFVLDDGQKLIQCKVLVTNGKKLGVASLNYQPAVGISFTTSIVSLLGLTGSDFDPCIQQPLSPQPFKSKPLSPERPKVGTKKTAVHLEPRDSGWRSLDVPPVVVCDPIPVDDPIGFDLGRNAALQSPHLYLQAAGSLGADSTRGIHLRWLLKRALSSHLPKANYAVPGVNFNKVDDFVQIYRAPYSPGTRSVAFKERANLVNSYEWIYVSGSQSYYLNFLDRARYDAVRAIIDPAVDHMGFMTAYGDGLLELEHKTRLAYAVMVSFSSIGGAGDIDLELRSVEENTFAAPRAVSLRMRYNHEHKLFSENIRSIRFRLNQAQLDRVTFEFYDDHIQNSFEKKEWQFLGKYALSKNSGVVFNRLEPFPGLVHGKWLRYNDSAFVNVQNYRDKWNSGALPAEDRILETVNKYIDLSNNLNNPAAVEQFFYNDPNAAPIPGFEPEDEFDPSENQFDISNLYLLQVASLDYHIARMLGLGVLDLDVRIMTGQHVYLAEYFTEADLDDGLGARQVQHLYMSLPTALADERLPLAVDLKEPVPGVVFGPDTEVPQVLTDPDGYSADGHARYLSLYAEPLHEEPVDAPFFQPAKFFSSAERTLPVYAGIEYRKTGLGDWVKPELPFNGAWFNVDATVPPDRRQETRSIVIPDLLYPVFVHREGQSGWHDYSSYGINWFSRATSSAVIHAIETEIRPTNMLLPPTNVNALLVVPEQPLLLTTTEEQVLLGAIAAADNTLVRLTWDYNHGQELIDYHRAINGEQVSQYAELPDAEELFAEHVELYFRDEVPNAIGGKVLGVANGANPILAVVTTGEYVFGSMGVDPQTGLPVERLVPNLAPAQEANFIGSLLSVAGINYPIHQIDNSGAFPRFEVFKVDVDGNAVDMTTHLPASELSGPPQDGLFTVVENMAPTANWGPGNPLGILVPIEPTAIHREEIQVRQPDGSIDAHVQKFRGVFRNAQVTPHLEDSNGDGVADLHAGLYKITFTGFTMPHHSLAAGLGHRVDFYRGVVRVHTTGSPQGERKALTVVTTENIGGPGDLVLYVADINFVVGDPSYDAIETGVVSVNYYPGYRAYLFADAPHNLTRANILPSGDQQVRYTIFGLRSHDTGLGYYSRMSVPALMFAQAVSEPQQPRLPKGGLYATRPDFHGKATFTFTTVFEHMPYSVQYLRASDIQILNALYIKDNGGNPAIWTLRRVKEELLQNGADEWFHDRWRNVLGFNYTYPANPGNNGSFEELPPGGIAMPLPNNPNFITAMNDFIDNHNNHYHTQVPHIGNLNSLYQVVIPQSANNAELRVVDFLRETVRNCFLPLTEIPVIYQHIKGTSYQPLPKKQVVRDRAGALLSPNHPDFDMAPMAKIVGPDPSESPPKLMDETQFTDFNLDGASNAHYFYAVREFNLKMVGGPLSPILGPISMVHTAPPRAPEVVKVTPVLEQRNPNIAPLINLTINGYPPSQGIKTLQVHRATNGLDARSVRTMTKLAEVDVVASGMAANSLWQISDDFSDLGYVPYGDPLFYVLTVSREVEYADRNGTVMLDLVPSEPSKMVLTNIVENYPPDPPRLAYYATPVNGQGDLDQVTLVWNKKVHNGKYHLYKRNQEGNWIEIATVSDNADRLVVPLATTGLGPTLKVRDGTENVYHHFKVVTENFAGMISREEDVLTIHQPSLWHDIATL